MSKVILREFIPDDDSGIIYSSYPKGVYYGHFEEIKEPKDEWFAKFFNKVKDQLLTSRVLIACLQDFPDNIIGYSIISGMTLEFVYVKEAYRMQGIAHLLTRNKFGKINMDNLTNVGHMILTHHPEINQEMTNATTKH